MKRIIISAIIMVWAAAAVPGFSEEALTLEQARALAADHSNDLKNAALSMGIADLQKTAVKYGLYPVISANGKVGVSYSVSGSGQSGPGFSPSLGISLSQRIYEGGKYKVEKELAAVESNIAKSEWEDIYLQVRNTCDGLYYTYLESLSQEDAAQKELDAAVTLMTLTEGQLEAGIISNTTYLKVRADKATKELALQQVKKNTIIAKAELASYLAQSTLPPVEKIDMIQYTGQIQKTAAADTDTVKAVTDRLVAKGMAEAPALMKNRLSVTKAELNASLSKKEYSPTVSLSVSDSISADSGFIFTNGGSLTVSGSLSLSQWDRKSALRQADMNVQQASNNSNETIRQYILQVQSGWYDILSASRSAVSAKSAMDYAEELYNETLEKYKLSAVSYSDLADAEALLSSNRSEYIGAQFDFLKSVSGMMFILGMKDEKTLWELIKI